MGFKFSLYCIVNDCKRHVSRFVHSGRMCRTDTSEVFRFASLFFRFCFIKKRENETKQNVGNNTNETFRLNKQKSKTNREREKSTPERRNNSKEIVLSVTQPHNEWHEKTTKQRLGMNSIKKKRHSGREEKKRSRKQKEILILSFISDRASLTASKAAFNILHVRNGFLLSVASLFLCRSSFFLYIFFFLCARLLLTYVMAHIVLKFTFFSRSPIMPPFVPFYKRFVIAKGNTVESVSSFYVQMCQQSSVKLTIWNFHFVFREMTIQ